VGQKALLLLGSFITFTCASLQFVQNASLVDAVAPAQLGLRPAAFVFATQAAMCLASRFRMPA
jgi:hypothetical protein